MSRSPKTRIESLTDLIFGLALSIGSVSLLSKPHNERIPEVLLSQNRFFSEVYRPRRGNLASKWTKMSEKDVS
jgi:zinc transporter ZupT